MDLTTKYMGLTLRSPLIASASPLNRDVGMLRQLEDHGAGAVVLPSIFEEEILAERREFELRVEELPAAGFAEAQTYFPTAARHATRARALSRAGAAGKAGGRDPGDRQLERHDARGVGRLRAPPGRGRGRRDRAQRLFHPGRPDDVGARRGTALPGDPGGGPGRREAPRRDQVEPVLQRHRRHGARARRPAAPTRWSSSTAFTSPTSTRRRCACRWTWSSARRPRSGCPCCGSGSFTGACRRRWPPPPGSSRRTTCSSTCWPAPTW